MRLEILASLFLGAAIVSTGCTSSVPSDGDDDDDSGDDDPGSNDPAALSGNITEDLTIDGEAHLTAAATIQPGVTVTFAPGSSLVAESGTTLTVEGTLSVVDSADAPVAMNPVAGAASWVGIVVESGGAATVSYATGSKVAVFMQCKAGAAACVAERLELTAIGKVMITDATDSVLRESNITDMANGGVTVQGSGELSVIDTVLYNASGDIVVQNGASTLVVDYSEIGAATGGYDHCNFHIGSAASVSITNSNIPDGVYGFMIGGVTGATITGNNFMGNGTDIQQIGTISAADFSGNYWSAGDPVLDIETTAAFDVTGAVASPIAGAGPRI